MSSRLLPILAVVGLVAVAVLVLSFTRGDPQAPIIVDGTGSSQQSGEGAKTSEVQTVPEPAAPAQGTSLPDRPPRPSYVEDEAGKNAAWAADRRPADNDSPSFAARLAELEKRLAELEASLDRAREENRKLKAQNEALKAERDRLAGINAPFDPAKLPKRKEFETTGEVVDDLVVYKPTGDGYWPKLRLETWLHPEIRRYRIKWFSGNWSPWFTPGVDDVDSKTNEDGTQRRIWSYFHDHEFQVER